MRATWSQATQHLPLRSGSCMNLYVSDCGCVFGQMLFM